VTVDGTFVELNLKETGLLLRLVDKESGSAVRGGSTTVSLSSTDRRSVDEIFYRDVGSMIRIVDDLPVGPCRIRVEVTGYETVTIDEFLPDDTDVREVRVGVPLRRGT